MSNSSNTSIVVSGDALAAGHGDARGLGWAGRVNVRTQQSVPRVLFYQLGIGQENTADLQKRCMPEARARFTTGDDNRLVLAPGSQDVIDGLSTARSRLNLANVLDSALSGEVRTFVVGPTPVLHPDVNKKIAELNEGFADVALRRGVPYVDMFTPLSDHPVWQGELSVTDGNLPSQEGYGLMAWLVLHGGWYPWLGVPQPAE